MKDYFLFHETEKSGVAADNNIFLGNEALPASFFLF